MLQAYISGETGLTQIPHGKLAEGLPQAVWIDMIEPTTEEEALVELVIGLDVPTRGELSAIEASSRLYSQDGGIFMTANLIRRGDDDRPEASPVSFVIKGKQLVSVRYQTPQAFPQFAKQAERQKANWEGWSVYLGLIEAVVDRAADHLERAGAILEQTSKQAFSNSEARQTKMRKPRDLRELLGKVGEEGDFTGKMYESLASISRMVVYAQGALDQQKPSREVKECRARAESLQRDILSLTDHATYLSEKISFQLDAVLGMISIEQNNAIKIFTVVSVAFLAPTLIASLYGMNFKIIPELQWEYGYYYALLLMLLSGIGPVIYFKWRGWF